LEEDAVQNEGKMENTPENGLGFTKTQQTMKSQDVSILDRNFRALFIYLFIYYYYYFMGVIYLNWRSSII
jgi:hypothetical protein